MVWYSYLFQNFPQFVVICKVKGSGIVNKAEVDVFLELSCFVDDLKDGLKLYIQKTKIMVSGPITSWQIDGETDSWRAQTKSHAHQDPGERSSDSTRD